MARVFGNGHSSEMITSVEGLSTDLSMYFNPSRNYTKPFNPAKIISFSLPSKTIVTLKVFNILGRNAATLINGKPKAENHYYQWDAEGFACGIYFFRLLIARSIAAQILLSITQQIQILLYV
jgi:hypothetical protein